MGTAHIHALSGLVRAAQAKHGSVEGMAAAMRERAAKRERAAASKQEAADARRQALALAAGLEDIRCGCRPAEAARSCASVHGLLCWATLSRQRFCALLDTRSTCFHLAAALMWRPSAASPATCAHPTPRAPPPSISWCRLCSWWTGPCGTLRCAR